MCLARIKSHLGRNVNYFFFLDWPFFNGGIMKISREIVVHSKQATGDCRNPMFATDKAAARKTWDAFYFKLLYYMNNDSLKSKVQIRW